MADFGSVDRRRFLRYAGTGALSAMVPFRLANNAAVWLHRAFPAKESAAPLKDLAAGKGLLFGSATSKGRLQSDKDYANLIAEQCAIITPENELKMKPLRPSPDAFRFDDADWMVQWAESHNIQVHGHTLVYGEPNALPPWANGYLNRGNAKQVMVNHITTVMRRYAGKIRSWDVVNEALESNGLKETVWTRTIGPEFLEIAYKTAGEADPNAMLVYNETNIEWAGQDSKRSGLLKLVRDLQSKKAPIHAVGIQSHLRYEMGGFDAGKMRKFLNQISDLGLKIRISELDCRERDSDVNVNDRDRTVAQYYADYLGAVLENKNVIAVETWNLTDRYTWLSHYAPRRDGQDVRPLPFDANLAPKPAYAAIAQAFERAPAR